MSKTSVLRAAQDEEILRLRISGLPLREIGKRVGLSHQTVADRITASIASVNKPLAGELRQLETERLDRLYEAATEVLERHHVTVSNGKIIYLGNEPLQDDGPVLAAIDRLLRVQERRAKLLGLDAPQQLDIVQEQRIDLDGQLVADALAAALDALNLTDEQRATALAAAQQRLLDATPE